MRNRRRNEGAAEEADEVIDSASASKRAKIDHGEQVKQLFGSSAVPIFDDQ